jgi:hypothetical protein
VVINHVQFQPRAEALPFFHFLTRQAVLIDAGVKIPANIRRGPDGYACFGGYDPDSVATHRMVASVLRKLARLPAGRSVIMAVRVVVHASAIDKTSSVMTCGPLVKLPPVHIMG